MCHDKNYNSMMLVTGSSNFAHGVCCKESFTGQYCNEDDDHVCGPPSYVSDTSSSKYSALNGNRNYQMFAFCPGISHKDCGVSDSESKDMHLYAKRNTSVVSSTDIRYREGNPSYRQHDFCFYEITIDINEHLEILKM